VIVDDFDLPGMFIPPLETYAPLIIDADAPLALALSVKSFQAIPWRTRQFVSALHAVDLPQLSKGRSIRGCKSTAMLAPEKPFRFFIRKGPDHILP